MKQFFLAIILIACVLPAFADECDQIKIYKTVIDDVPVYKVMDGNKMILNTYNVTWAIDKAESVKEACQTRVANKKWHKILNDANWVEVE
jgi:hypothetical protein